MPDDASDGIARGCWVTLSDPLVARRLAEGGFDWICVDRQHSVIEDRDLAEIARATHGLAASFRVRVRSASAADIGFALDVGASVVVVPMVDTAAMARSVVSAAYYPPVGQRSWGQISTAWTDLVAPSTANDRVGVWAMIETRAGLENAQEIAAVPGITGLFVGPYDLSIGLGLSLDELLMAREPDSPLLRIVAAARAAGVTAAAYAGDPSRAGTLADAGFTEVAITSDVALLEDGIRRAVPR